ncbi:MAG: TIGR01458 family HAD-type hydrolase [Verrucomicrobiae bacterium]|nr:TIGR01458 family HAD-type hydrolase [Verrucomicrobiae bacterium]
MPVNAEAVLFDLSGVLYEGSQLVPDANRVVDRARSMGLIVRFVTNTATKAREDILDKLGRLGISAEPDELYTAPTAAVDYLQANRLRPYCLVHEAIEYEFRSFHSDSPNAVLLGDARMKLHYDSLNRAFQLCMKGAPLIAIGKNRYFKTEEELQLDAGAFVTAIEWAAGIEAVIVGKPGKPFFDAVVASTGVDAGECLMVGDDLEGDVIGALDAGLQATMVKTGKFRPEDEAKLPETATLIDSVVQLFD